ncbi:MAG: adenylosuccinate synthase [Gemmataceae bacterium]
MTPIFDQSKPQATCVVGLQWGDEAKGKLVDILAEEHDFVVRYNGGANAGHTVVRDGQTFKFSLLPTGVLRENVTSIIGNGVVVHPVKFIEEVEQLRAADLAPEGRLLLSDRAHVIFPYHMEEERLNELGQNGEAIGTTRRGIGPCYADKVSRVCGIRVGELRDPAHLRKRMESVVPRKNRILKALGDSAVQFDVADLSEEYNRHATSIVPFVADTTRVLIEAYKNNKRILFEGAQGSLLDVDHGTYPYVTSSNSTTAGVWSGSGFPARNLNRVLGVIKAYTTRVGNGAFPTELDDGPAGIGEQIRRAGKEYGTVTGRPRRCGWLDLVACRYTSLVSGVDRLAIMLLDVLSGLPELKICTAYDLEGERIDYFPVDANELQRCKPIYETLTPWSEPIDQLKTLSELPSPARRYLDRIGEFLELPVEVVSVGPDRVQTIIS